MSILWNAIVGSAKWKWNFTCAFFAKFFLPFPFQFIHLFMHLFKFSILFFFLFYVQTIIRFEHRFRFEYSELALRRRKGKEKKMCEFFNLKHSEINTCNALWNWIFHSKYAVNVTLQIFICHKYKEYLASFPNVFKTYQLNIKLLNSMCFSTLKIGIVFLLFLYIKQTYAYKCYLYIISVKIIVHNI